MQKKTRRKEKQSVSKREQSSAGRQSDIPMWFISHIYML